MATFLKFLVVSNLLIFNLNAKDLGVYGHTFPIIEKSLLQSIKDKFQGLSEKEVDLVNKRIQFEYVSKIIHPLSLGLPEAKTYRCFFYDPTVYASKTIQDKNGNVIVQKGKHYNPLEAINLSEDLLFFDGNNSKHIEWAQKNKGKWILTNGSPIDLEKSLEKPIYFDQRGKITQKIGIESIPAKVSQHGNKLKIEEIPCTE